MSQIQKLKHRLSFFEERLSGINSLHEFQTLTSYINEIEKELNHVNDNVAFSMRIKINSIRKDLEAMYPEYHL
jgi:predicted  nucleic acid-binding Zn-ribbon protein